jgi:hypothetical protein
MRPLIIVFKKNSRCGGAVSQGEKMGLRAARRSVFFKIINDLPLQLPLGCFNFKKPGLLTRVGKIEKKSPVVG